jgi:hypothetical protein
MGFSSVIVDATSDNNYLNLSQLTEKVGRLNFFTLLFDVCF